MCKYNFDKNPGKSKEDETSLQETCKMYLGDLWQASLNQKSQYVSTSNKRPLGTELDYVNLEKKLI